MEKSKKIISFLLAITMICLVPMNTVVFAKELENVSSEQINLLNEYTYSSDEVYLELKNIGFSDKEMLDLYQQEANRKGKDFKLPKILYENTGSLYVFSETESIETFKFPTKPKVGQWHQENYSINFATIARSLGWAGGGTGAAYLLANVSKNQLAKAIVSSAGMGIFSAALSIAGVFFGEVSRHHNGMTATIKYLYTYNNDAYLTWVMGSMSHRFW